jgi:hypothetical protein
VVVLDQARGTIFSCWGTGFDGTNLVKSKTAYAETKRRKLAEEETKRVVTSKIE